MTNSKQSLQARAEKARAAADKAVESGQPKDKQRELAAVAVGLEEQVRFEDWKQIQEEAGYTVEGDSFANATVSEITEGPTYDDKPGV
jgi:hypothetical protein